MELSEQEEMLHLLIKEIEFDGVAGKVKMALHPGLDVGHIVKRSLDEFAVIGNWLPLLDSNQQPFG